MERMLIVMALMGILAAATLGAGIDLRDTIQRQIDELQITLDGRAAIANDLSRQIDELNAPPTELPTPEP